MRNPKTFPTKIRDASKSGSWMEATAFYEDGEVEYLIDDQGAFLPLSTLSAFDRDLVDKALILNLQADEENEIDYISDWAGLTGFNL
jgi:hypothetical protein